MKAFILIVCCLGHPYANDSTPRRVQEGFSYQAEWSYDAQDQWPGVCTTGTLQSPIDISTSDAVVDHDKARIRSSLVFSGYGEVTTTATNNGHALQWSLVSGTQAPVIAGGPLDGNYTFTQFHLHWLSEHAIDGNKYPVEIHLVHIKSGLELEEALTRPDGLAVVAVLGTIQNGRSAETALSEIVPTVAELVEPESETEAAVINVARILSPNLHSFFTYQGSLTTPNCDEVVTWIVLDQPIAISQSQYDQFSTVNLDGHTSNYRDLQPVNRVVYHTVASR